MTEQDLRQLYDQYHRQVTVYLRAVVGDWELARDLAQETFVVACRPMTKLDANRSPGPWLYGIARNLARNALRKRARHRELLLEESDLENAAPSGDPAGHGVTGWEEMVESLDACMEELPSRQRQVVDLFYRERRSAREVAGQLGVKEETIFQLLWHARRNLRDCVRNKTAETQGNSSHD